MKRFFCSTSIAVLFNLAFPSPGPAQEPFYKGKTVRIVVATSAGGGFDTYTRAIARQHSTFSLIPRRIELPEILRLSQMSWSTNELAL